MSWRANTCILSPLFVGRFSIRRGGEETLVSRDIFVPHDYANPEDAPYECHDPSWTRVSVEDWIPEPNLVEQTSKKWTGCHA
ncbi:hypothetical protein AX14_013629 [Amanita brunnescens Koide BX004]|nr:hypothetical protein AX14_013629 [Amanita brunnescens Koide BX004]